MPYFLIIALQGFCLYHVYKNRNHYYWFFIIILLPVLGSIVYLATQVFKKKDLDIVQDEIVKVINPTKKIKDLQRQLDFADTFQNRVNLADALFEIDDYAYAIEEYEKVLANNNDIGVVKKLIEAYHKTRQFNKVIFCAEKMISKTDFKSSRSEFLYGLALKEDGQLEKAEEHLRHIDQRYSNYQERYILAQFLIERGKIEDSKEILFEILTESEHMSKPNRIKYGTVVSEVKKLMSTL